MITTPIILTIIFHIADVNSVSIGVVSDKRNVKRELKHELFPDWVPFKNKHGAELGEFVRVKAKPKKRLALPTNFVLKAVIEEPSDDYYDKGGNDNEDYYEKKDWSDVDRPANSNPKAVINHPDISDIDGVVNIITNGNKSIQTKQSEEDKNQRKKTRNKESREITTEKPTQDIKEESSSSEKEESEASVETAAVENESVEPKVEKTKDESVEKEPSKEVVDTKEEEDADYIDQPKKIDEETKKQEELTEEEIRQKEEEQRQTEEERRQNEEKKAKILDSVDELKNRHELEQKAISEKLKEEELSREQAEIDSSSSEESNKYSGKYKPNRLPDYSDEYDEREPPIQDKYVRLRPENYVDKSTTTTPENTKSTTAGNSVFNNPSLYYTDEESPKYKATYKSTGRPAVSPRKKPEDSVRISLIPHESSDKTGEPAQFFPRRRKPKRKRKPTTPPPSSDSYVAETKEQDAKDLVSAPALTGPSGSGSAETAPDITASGSSSFKDTTAPEASRPAAVVLEPALDAQAASTHDHKEKKEEDYHREKGGGKEHHSEYHDEHGESGKKAYEGVHKDYKTKKGHHDKQDHLDKYEDHGGIDKNHHEEKGFYGDHHHEEHGKKHAKYEESGKHSKGHSTKGSHDIHKKEEYEKKVEFFEEEGDSAEEEKHGGHNQEHEYAKGGHFKRGGLDAGHHGRQKGERGHFAKGAHADVHKGHTSSGGHDAHGQGGSGKFQKEGKASGKKWIFHHGHPAKTANLVIIDRRGDQYFNGPRFGY